MRRIIVFGATSLIAQHVLRRWLVEAPAEVHLVARDASRMSDIARDARVRAPGSAVHEHVIDLLDQAAVEILLDDLLARPVELVLIAHGSLPSQAGCQADRGLAAHTLLTNGNSAALIAEACASRMDRSRRASVVVIGSVAGDRGRRSNYVYGAAKAMLATYVEGLQHRFAGTALHVLLVKPGPTATPMTAGLGRKQLASPERVAADIVRAVERRRPVVFTPAPWRLIMLAIRHLPRVVFDRIDI